MNKIVEPSRKSGIYEIICVTNGKSYIGSASDLYRRSREHERALSKGSHFNRHLQAAYTLYGEESFLFDIIEYCDKSILLTREAYHFRTRGVGTPSSFNMSLSPNNRLGNTLSAEAKNRISVANTGRIKTADAIQKTRLANLGKERNLEFRKQNMIRERSKSKITLEIANEVRRLALEEEYKVYGGRKKLARYFGLSKMALSHILAGRTWNAIDMTTTEQSVSD